MSNHPERVLVVGFDGLDFRYLDAFEEDLPNFAALRRSGVERPLESTFPPMTPTAWPSFYTGVSPSHHGVFDFFRIDRYPDQGEVVSRNDVRAPALWNYLTTVDVPSIVLNVPVTHPPEEIEGIVVPGGLSPEGPPTYPEWVREKLVAELGDYYVYPREGDAGSVEKLTEKMRMRGEAAVYLLSEQPWQLGIVEFQSTDSVFHEFDDESDYREVYRTADRLLGRLRELVDDDTAVLVVSDHGIGPMDGWKVNLNTVLDDEGFIETTTDSSILSHVEIGAPTGVDGEGDSEAGRTQLQSIIRALSTLGITPRRVMSGLSALGVDDLVREHARTGLGEMAREGVDWQRSTAYFDRFPQLGVRINLEGREPDGVVSESEYEVVRERIIRTLEELETPSNDPVFEWVAPREEVYDGPYAEEAADVLFMPTDMDNFVDYRLPLDGGTFESLERNHHKPTGVFLATGPGLSPAEEGGSLSITDVAPAIMALLDQAVPERMTGTVPTDVLTVGHSERAYGDVEFGSDRTGTDDAVTDRLEDLGYL